MTYTTNILRRLIEALIGQEDAAHCNLHNEPFDAASCGDWNYLIVTASECGASIERTHLQRFIKPFRSSDL